MIKVLGTKRILILLVLIGVNAAFAAITFLYLIPEKASKDIELRGEQAKVSAKSSDIQQLTVEIQILKEQQGDYEELVERGFFSNQNRSDARGLLERVRDRSGVLKATISGGELSKEENELAQKAGYVLLASTVDIELDALHDRQVYAYINMLKSSLPGYLSVEKIIINREMELNGAVLRLVSSNQEPKIITANIALTWRTMVTEEEYGRIEAARN